MKYTRININKPIQTHSHVKCDAHRILQKQKRKKKKTVKANGGYGNTKAVKLKIR